MVSNWRWLLIKFKIHLMCTNVVTSLENFDQVENFYFSTFIKTNWTFVFYYSCKLLRSMHLRQFQIEWKRMSYFTWFDYSQDRIVNVMMPLNKGFCNWRRDNLPRFMDTFNQKKWIYNKSWFPSHAHWRMSTIVWEWRPPGHLNLWKLMTTNFF